MNTNDLLLRWSHMTLDQIEDEIRAGRDQESAVQLLGPEMVAEMRAVSFAPPEGGVPEPVVLLPGVMGSDLSSVRGITSLIWVNPLVFVKGTGRYLALDDEGQNDRCPEVSITPIGLSKMVYLRMELALNRAAELFEFPYDWRRPVVYNADRLHESIERWGEATGRKVSIVAHSMGGLVSRAYMARHPKAAEKRVRQLIMLGTPNYGATNAVSTLFGGNDLIDKVDGLNASNQMKPLVRGLPGLYDLLPAPPEFFPSGRPYPADWNLYDAPSWRIDGIRQNFLDGAYALQRALAESDPQVRQIMFAGCNRETVIRVRSNFSDESNPRLVDQRIREGEDAGDGTVPLWSALLPRAETFYVYDKHGDMPAGREIIQAVLGLLRGGVPDLPTALPEPRRTIAGIAFDAAVEPALEYTPTAELREKINAGAATRNDLKQLFFAL